MTPFFSAYAIKDVFRNIEIRICVEDGYDLNEYFFVSHL